MHVWVYMMMLPVSLSLFETFDVVHLLSIGWTMLFMLFYPVALGLHLIGEGGLLESAVISLLGLPTIQQVTMAPATVVVHGVTALLAVRYRWAVWLLLLLTLTIVVYAVDQVT
jgi:competence protein ComEC